VRIAFEASAQMCLSMSRLYKFCVSSPEQVSEPFLGVDVRVACNLSPTTPFAASVLG